MTPSCGMIRAHHPDCRCARCEAGQDERCPGVAVATLIDSRRAALRVCDECAVAMHLEDDGYWVRRDDGRAVLSS